MYPPAIQWLVRVSPLYHATTLIRSLTLGGVGWANLADAAYLLALGLAGIWLARRRMAACCSPDRRPSARGRKMGDRGFEPRTSALSERRSNQLS